MNRPTIEFIADESGVISRANLLHVIIFFSFTFAVVPCGIFLLIFIYNFFMRRLSLSY